MKAKKARKAPDSTPSHAGTDAGHIGRRSKSGAASRPATMAATRPTISIRPITAAIATLSRTPTAAIPVNPRMTRVTSSHSGRGTSTPRYCAVPRAIEAPATATASVMATPTTRASRSDPNPWRT